MSDLISKEDAKWAVFCNRGNVAAQNDAIDALPTVDAVPVVRCKDCKFSDWYTAMDGNRYCYCMEHGSSGHQENDFCSYGEKDGDGND